MSLRNLTRYRSNIVDNVSKLKTQIINILDKFFPEYTKVFSDTFGSSSKQILINCPTPDELLKFNTIKLSNILSKSSKGRFSKEKVYELKLLAKSTFGIKITDNACSFEIKQLVNQIIFLEDQFNELNIEIENIYLQLDNHLITIPGIGQTIAPIILAEFGDINNFSSPSKLTVFAGIDPTQNHSGKQGLQMKRLQKEVFLTYVTIFIKQHLLQFRMIKYLKNITKRKYLKVTITT